MLILLIINNHFIFNMTQNLSIDEIEDEELFELDVYMAGINTLLI